MMKDIGFFNRISIQPRNSAFNIHLCKGHINSFSELEYWFALHFSFFFTKMLFCVDASEFFAVVEASQKRASRREFVSRLEQLKTNQI